MCPKVNVACNANIRLKPPGQLFYLSISMTYYIEIEVLLPATVVILRCVGVFFGNPRLVFAKRCPILVMITPVISTFHLPGDPRTLPPCIFNDFCGRSKNGRPQTRWSRQGSKAL